MTESGSQKLHIDYFNDALQQRQPLEHLHDTYELDLFIQADIQIFVKDRKYRVNGGDMLFINAFELHRVLYPSNQVYTRYVLNFHRTYIENLLTPFGLFPMFKEMEQRSYKKVTLDLQQRIRAEDMCKTILRLQRELTHDAQADTIQTRIKESELKINVLRLITCFFEQGKKASLPYKGNHAEQIVKDIIHYIDHHYTEPVQLRDLEEALGLSKYHLSHLFRDSSGFTIVEYLQYRRIAEAQRKLVHTALSIVEISAECGFPSLPYFYRVFKKVTQTSPSHYRKRHQ